MSNGEFVVEGLGDKLQNGKLQGESDGGMDFRYPLLRRQPQMRVAFGGMATPCHAACPIVPLLLRFIRTGLDIVMQTSRGYPAACAKKQTTAGAQLHACCDSAQRIRGLLQKEPSCLYREQLGTKQVDTKKPHLRAVS